PRVACLTAAVEKDDWRTVRRTGLVTRDGVAVPTREGDHRTIVGSRPSDPRTPSVPSPSRFLALSAWVATGRPPARSKQEDVVGVRVLRALTALGWPDARAKRSAAGGRYGGPPSPSTSRSRSEGMSHVNWHDVARRTRARHGLLRVEDGLLTRSQIRTAVDAGILAREHTNVLRLAGAPRTEEQRTLYAVWAAAGLAAASRRSASTVWGLSDVWPDHPDVCVAPPRLPRLRGAHVHRSAALTP